MSAAGRQRLQTAKANFSSRRRTASKFLEVVSMPQIVFEMAVGEIMHRWPATIRVFLDFRMVCIGCPIAGFHTVADACREHGVAPIEFLDALRRTIAAQQQAQSAAVGLRGFGNAEQSMRVP
jgi:hybrid cluster-associated redox disulfide protein